MITKQKLVTKFSIIISIFVMATLISACAKTVSEKNPSATINKLQTTFKAAIQIANYDYFFIIGNNTTPERNPNYITVPILVPGYRPGEISLFETSKSAEQTRTFLRDNTTYFATWSDIIRLRPGTTNSYEICNGPFPTPQTFLELENICQSRWQATNKLSTSGSSSTRLGFQFSIDILQGNPLELDELSLAILTVEKVNALDFTESYGRTLTDWVDRPNDGLSNLNLRNIIPLSQILTSNTCDGTESAACVDSVSYERVR